MRNLVLRILVAVAGVPLMLYLATVESLPLAVMVVVLQAAILAEWRRLCKARGLRPCLSGVILAAIGVDFAVFTAGEASALGAAGLALAILFVLEVFRPQREPIANLGAASLYILYVVVPLSLWTALNRVDVSARFEPAGALVVLLVATWVCDSAAFLVGRGVGKHKLYPAASPVKTIEGFLGGVAAGAVVLPIMSAWGWVDPSRWDLVFLPLIVGVLGQCGDLLESLMKREAGVKDSSAVLPGHGGFLDRFDSLLLSTPFFFAYLILTAR